MKEKNMIISIDAEENIDQNPMLNYDLKVAAN